MKFLNSSPLLLPLIVLLSCRAIAFSPRYRGQSPQLIRQHSKISSSIALKVSNDLVDSSGSEISSSNGPGVSHNSSSRKIARIHKFARLPVWPVWQGVFLFFASKLFGQQVAAQWEDSIGGRVCPNFFSPIETSPFVLMVHHRHAFMNWDPIRYIQQTFFPEGFPAHPHRGFITVTYCLKGGMIHRDSLGIKQIYGAEERHGGRHVQWLTAGAGIQHEEMWDVREPDAKDKGSFLWTSSQELYQIWLNLPAAYKMSAPGADMLEAYAVKENSSAIPTGSTPIITSMDESTITTIVCGEYNGVKASVECPTDASIIRVQLKKKERNSPTVWTHNLPPSHKTAILYIRKGSIDVDGEHIGPHHTVYLTASGAQLTITKPHDDDNDEADVLLLSGAPLNEPIASQGSMVMNTDNEIREAYMDFQNGFMGVPWSEKLTDEEWRKHVARFPSRY
mmetsp:Transcript_16093/g.31875  ORF Transcript_16093/g.31875 Transcript_16093/m.31875 type:complete len:449 (+) Transcript_16093:211-1557(+)